MLLSRGSQHLTALDMYEALQARQVKQTTAAVCEIDRNQVLTVNHITNFIALHNSTMTPEVS